MLEQIIFNGFGRAAFFGYRMLSWLLRPFVKYVGPILTGLFMAILTLFSAILVMGFVENVAKPQYGAWTIFPACVLIVVIILFGMPVAWGAIGEIVEEQD